MALTPTLKTFGKVVLGMGLIASMVMPNHIATRVAHAAYSGPLVIADQTTGTWVRDFNPYDIANQNSPTLSGIYETLYITSTHNGNKQTPLLATGYSWSKDLKSLTFTIRQGVKWSDGSPFSADDVVFSAQLGQTCGVANTVGWWDVKDKSGKVISPGSLASVTESADKSTVTFTYKTVDTTVFVPNFNNFYVVPKAVWSAHAKDSAQGGDCDTWKNPDPVGTGPFTQVQSYSAQTYVLGKNPNYYLPGEPKVSSIEFLDHTGNDTSTNDFINGKVDWSGNALGVNAVNSGTRHFQYSAPNVPVQLIFINKYPYNIPAFRQAVSMALDRKTIVGTAEAGFGFQPADALGLASQWPDWIAPSVKAQDTALSTYNLTAAKALLAKAGFTVNKDGTLLDPKGKPVDFDIQTVTGWTDWYTAVGLIASELGGLGINAGVHQTQFGAWQNTRLTGTFDCLIFWQLTVDSPISLYGQFMAANDYYPVGTLIGNGNDLGRYQSAAADAALKAARATADVSTQKAKVAALEKIWLNDLPTIPLWIAGLWENYNTQHFTGFPVAGNYYASGQPGDRPDRELVLLNVKPV